MIEPFYNYSYSELCQLFDKHQLSKDLAKKLYRNFHKHERLNFDGLSLSNKSKDFVLSHFHFSTPEIKTIESVTEEENGTTVKFLFQLCDKTTIESVLIPFQNKYALCLSSQVGCAMKCSFCYTGTQGLKRNLEVHEIVGQLIHAKLWLHKNIHLKSNDQRAIKSVVFMGQGEPLHNYENVAKACNIFMDQHGLSLSKERITISTAGFLPGLKKWVADQLPVNVALSLHSTDSEKRNALIPINQHYPLEDVISLLKQIPMQKKQYITYEYLLIKNFNESLQDAEKVALLVKETSGLVNLIPYNPVPGLAFEKPEIESVQNFKLALESKGIATTIRATKGEQILAACGQLKSKY